MTSNTKAIALASFMTGILVVLSSSFHTPPVRAAFVANAQYKVITTRDYPDKDKLEDALNQFAVDGWRVQTSLGGYLILAK